MATRRILFLLAGLVLLAGSCIASSYGKTFVTAFLCNHKQIKQNVRFELLITGYHPETTVTATVNKPQFLTTIHVSEGQTVPMVVPTSAEMLGTGIFDGAVLIQGNKDVSVFLRSHKGITTGATLVYPVQWLGTLYYVVTPEGDMADTFKEFAVVAYKAPTRVDIHLKGSVTFKGQVYPAGSTLVVDLKAFQAIQLQSTDDLSGTRVESKEPVAVLSGHSCAKKSTSGCDHVIEQLLPVSSWETSFIVPPLSFQSGFDTVYVTASEKTFIIYRFGPTQGSHNMEAGQVMQFPVQFPQPFYISSDTGIQVLFFFAGDEHRSIFYDPFLINVAGIASYCRSYHMNGMSQFDNYAVIIAKTSESSGFTLDKTAIGNIKWSPIPDTEYSWAEHSLGKIASAFSLEHSSTPFGLFILGVLNRDGYGSVAPCSSGSSVVNTRGRAFVTAFLYNAWQDLPNTKFELLITGHHPSTSVTVKVNKSVFRRTISVSEGQRVSVELPSSVEMLGTNTFNETVLIQANKDISVFSHNYKEHSTGATIVYPVQQLGTMYYVITPVHDISDTFKEFAVVAYRFPARVNIQLKGRVTFKGRVYPAGTRLGVDLEAFQAIQLQSSDDLSGTQVESNELVAVLNGHSCARKNSNCDHIVEQLLPVSSWGTTFIIPPLSFQTRFDIAYVIASQNASISYQSGPTQGSHNVGAGQVIQFEIRVSQPLHISSDSGIQVLFFFAGALNGSRTEDPFLIHIPAVTSYCRSYHIDGIRQYDNYAVIIVNTTESGGITLEKKPIGNVNWRPIPGTEYSWGELSLGRGENALSLEHPSTPFGLLILGVSYMEGYGSVGLCTSR